MYFLSNVILILFVFTVGLYLLLLRRINGAWDTADPRLLFAGLFLLYGTTEPLFRHFGFSSAIFIKSNTLYLLGALGLLSSLLTFSIFPSKKKKKESPSSYLPISPKILGGVSLSFLALGFIGLYYHYQPIGLYTALRLPKGQVGDLLGEISKTRISLPYFFVILTGFLGTLFSLVHSHKQNKRILSKVLLAISTLGITSFWVAFGSRRRIFFLALVALGVLATKYSLTLSTKQLIVIAMIAIAVFSLFEVTRFSTLKKQGWDWSKLEPNNALAEFSNPYGTLLLAIENDVSLRYGKTYLESIGVAMPNLFYPGDKPINLGKEWRRKYNRQLFSSSRSRIPGLGFLPITEAYINFGFIGPLLELFLIGAFLNFINKVKTTKNIYLALLFPVLLVLIFYLNRASIGTVFRNFLYLWVFTSMIYLTTKVLTDISPHPKNKTTSFS